MVAVTKTFGPVDPCHDMAHETCDACGETVPIGGGIAAMWATDPKPTGGLALSFPDGAERFVCFECLETLRQDPTPAAIDALAECR